MEHPLLLSSLGVMLALILGFLWHQTKPAANTAEATEPPPCKHTGSITQFFENLTLQDGRIVRVAISFCKPCTRVLPPTTDTFWKLPPDMQARLCEYYENQGLDASELRTPPEPMGNTL